MPLKIEKLVSEQYLPLTKQNNLINFIVPKFGSTIDFMNSYLQFTLNVTSATSQRLSFGQDNLPYYPVCMIRRCRLVSSTKGTISEVNNLNILMHNLLFYNKTTSENTSDALYGWGAVAGSDYVHSVFTDYQPGSNNCVVKIPCAHLFPGTIGHDMEYPVDGDLTIMLELEPTKNLFQQVVSYRWNAQNIGDFKNTLDVVVAGENNQITVQDVTNNPISVDSHVVVKYTDNSTVDYIVTAVDGLTLTLNNNLTDGKTPATVTYDNSLILCNPYNSTNAPNPPTSLVLGETALQNDQGLFQQFNDLTNILDIMVNGQNVVLPLRVAINYWTYLTAGGGPITAGATITTSLLTATLSEDKTTLTMTFADALPTAPSNSTVAGITITPLNTNVNDAVWTVTNAYAFVYRDISETKEKPKEELHTVFTYEPLPQVSDGTQFSREVQVSGNAYNLFLLTPPIGSGGNPSQLYSFIDGIENYRFFLNDVALSNIPISLSTTVDLDMKMRVYSNSEFTLRNINGLKNKPLYKNNNVTVLPAKLKPKTMGGKPNFINNTERKALRVELNGMGMSPAKTIYFFKEEYKLI